MKEYNLKLEIIIRWLPLFLFLFLLIFGFAKKCSSSSLEEKFSNDIQYRLSICYCKLKHIDSETIKTLANDIVLESRDADLAKTVYTIACLESNWHNLKLHGGNFLTRNAGFWAIHINTFILYAEMAGIYYCYPVQDYIYMHYSAQIKSVVFMLRKLTKEHGRKSAVEIYRYGRSFNYKTKYYLNFCKIYNRF